MGVTTGCTSVTYLEATVVDDALVIAKDQLLEVDFVLVKHAKLNTPIYLRKKDDQYLAVLLECTHKQCEVRPGAQLLKCPCHGSEFDSEGHVLSGPAEQDLHSFNTWHNERQIFIQ